MPKPYLLLVDINGLLCLRSEVRIPNLRADLKLRKRFIYARPGIHDFLTTVMDAGFNVYVYTSMTKKNAIPIIRAVVPNLPQLTEQLFDRKMNKHDPDGKHPWTTMRDMDKIWSILPEFGPHNTVFVDSDLPKYREILHNGIKIDPLTSDDIIEKDRYVLKRVQKYLLKLAKAAPSDFQAYMTKKPLLGEGEDTDSAIGESNSDTTHADDQITEEEHVPNDSSNEDAKDTPTKQKPNDEEPRKKVSQGADLDDLTETLLDSLLLNKD